MFTQLRSAVIVFLALTLVTGIAYPLAITGMAQVLFPHQANGSLISEGGKVVGSELLGQTFDDPRYFWSRPSAVGYDAAASGGSNLGPTNPALLEAVQHRAELLRKASPDSDVPAPVDLVTASGSGLDPHISPAAAHHQAARIALHRNLPLDQVRALIARHTEGRTFGILGEPRVNVLLLNRALDAHGDD